MEIKFFFQAGVRLLQRKKLKAFIKFLFKNENVVTDHVHYIFCNDAYLLSINQSFLSHDTLTDIISFNLAEKGNPVQGEIYISTERVAENALIHNVSKSDELLRVMIHGLLHFCDYSDKNYQQQQEMREMEDKYMLLYVSRETF